MTAFMNVSCRIVESFGKKDDCVLMNCRKILPTYKLATSVNNAVKPSLLVGKTGFSWYCQMCLICSYACCS